MAGGLVAGVFFSSILSDGGLEGLAAPPCARGFSPPSYRMEALKALRLLHALVGFSPPSYRMEALKALRLLHALVGFTPPSYRMEALKAWRLHHALVVFTPPSYRMEALKALRLLHALVGFSPPSYRMEALIIGQLIIIIIKKFSFLCYITYRKCCIYAKLLLTLHLRKILI